MSVKKEKNVTTKLSGKGILRKIDLENQCFVIEDVKEGTLDLLKFEDIKELLNKEITYSFQNKEEE
jgi:hypothetical protein